MRVIVCGAGQVGFNIARHLATLGNDVTVVDQSEALIQQISEQLDVRALIGHAADPSMLSRAGAEDTDMLVAVTLSDEVNMIACQVASSLFQIPTKIARIRNQIYLKRKWADLFSHDSIPIDVHISPEQEVSKALARRLTIPGAFNMIPFMKGRVRVIGLELDESCPVLNTPLKQLSELFPNLMTTVIGISRAGSLFVPRSADSLQVGDRIYIAVEDGRTQRAMGVFGREEATVNRVVIIGGGNIGLFLAKRLEKMTPKRSVKLIERNRERAEYVASQLDDAVVIHGDALNNDILSEAAVGDADTIVAVADDDEVNILSSLLSKRQGCPRAMTLLNNTVYAGLTGSLDIDVALDPRETTVSSIVRHIRRGRVRDLYTIEGGTAEVLEMEVIQGSEIASHKLSDLKFAHEVRLGIIERDGDFMMPSADTQLQAGDRVLLLTLASAVKQVEKLFSARADIF